MSDWEGQIYHGAPIRSEDVEKLFEKDSDLKNYPNETFISLIENKLSRDEISDALM